MNHFLDEFLDPEADISRALEAVRHVLMNHRGLGSRWREVSIVTHLRHAITHCAMHATGNRREPHLAHAATRVLMALQLFREGR
jgi:hypothetical protein